MAQDKQNSAGSVAGSGSADRLKKAAATRAINAGKIAKLSGEDHYAFTRLSLLRSSLDKLQSRILDGGHANAELVAACAQLDEQIGRAMFS